MEIKCTQCGGSVPIEYDTVFVRCPFCETALYVDTNQTVKHYIMLVQSGEGDIAPIIQRELSYMEIKDPVTVIKADLHYFPFWRLENNKGGALNIPAASPLLEDMYEIVFPSGEFKFFSDDLANGKSVTGPEVTLDDALVEGEKLIADDSEKFTSASITHLPFYMVNYSCQNEEHEAVVEGISGKVYADGWPAAPQKQKDRHLGLIAFIAITLFFLEAFFPSFLPVSANVGILMSLGMMIVTGVLIYYYSMNTLKRMKW
jgi:hypothetical protein